MHTTQAGAIGEVFASMIRAPSEGVKTRIQVSCFNRGPRRSGLKEGI